MDELIACLKKYNVSIGSCESLTAGMFVSHIADYAGTSTYLKGGLVTYQATCKEDVLKIPHEMIERYGVVSKEIASEMAVRAKAILHCDICVSFTGNAGPGALDGKEVGRIYCAIAYLDQVFHYSYVLDGGRNEIREKICDVMAQEVKKVIEEEGNHHNIS